MPFDDDVATDRHSAIEKNHLLLAATMRRWAEEEEDDDGVERYI